MLTSFGACKWILLYFLFRKKIISCLFIHVAWLIWYACVDIPHTKIFSFPLSFITIDFFANFYAGWTRNMFVENTCWHIAWFHSRFWFKTSLCMTPTSITFLFFLSENLLFVLTLLHSKICAIKFIYFCSFGAVNTTLRI